MDNNQYIQPPQGESTEAVQFTQPQPAQLQPAYQQPAQPQPAYQQPAQPQPACQQPAQPQPACQQPAQPQLAYQQPVYQQPVYPQAVYAYQPKPKPPAHGLAITSLVLGITSVVFWFFGMTAVVSLILGIVGCIMASMAKKRGNTSGMCMAGFVLSLIGLIIGAAIFGVTLSCLGSAACTSCASASAIGSSYYY